MDDLADALKISDPIARGIVTGGTEITSDLADGLANLFGTSPSFWLRREDHYRESLQWLAADELAATLPLSQMVEYGWIENHEQWRERAAACLEFFDVSTLDEWRGKYGEAVSSARFRASTSFAPDTAAVAAWLRQAQIEAGRVRVGAWSRERFRSVMSAVRALTKHRDPAEFVPRLQELCAATGVAVVVVRAPRGAPVSGAAMLSERGVPTIALSARFLSDDHLWFTFFHEAGHVLHHDLSGEGFIDALDGDSADLDALETEANDFARDILVPGGVEHLGSGRSRGPLKREVVAFASRTGVAPGVVVGQLQHVGRIEHSQLNFLKRRYRWEGSLLTQRT